MSSIASSPAIPSLLYAEMTRRERVMAAVRGEDVDRLPVCFWHHFQPAGSGRKLADASLRFFDEMYDLDILKLMPDIPYPFPHKSIQSIEDWRLIEPLEPTTARFFTERLEAVRVARDELGFDTPIVVTVFSPLCEALYFSQSPAMLLQHAAESPAVVHRALGTIAENLRAHIRDVLAAGADGVFFALQGCSTNVMSVETYRELGRPYDLLALQGASSGWLNILHLHGDKDLIIDEVLDYPVDVLSWSDRIAGPSLRDARALTSKCLMGGWNEFGPLSNGPASKIREEAEDALAQTAGRKFILANGCSVPDDVDPQWLHAARDIVEQLDLN